MAELMVTGGAGFIGANFVHYWRARHPEDTITVLDALTYAGSRESLAGLDGAIRLVEGDLTDTALVDALVAECDAVVHFAAETHVDNSLDDPAPFLRSNVVGTFSVLEAVRRHGVRLAQEIDWFSSGCWFDGWREKVTRFPAGLTRPVVRARSWLLDIGWRRHGLICCAEVPG